MAGGGPEVLDVQLPAAGSRYVEIPVELTATTNDGRTQRFQGTVTLRRSVVVGATLEQRRWHIYTAKIPELPAGNQPQQKSLEFQKSLPRPASLRNDTTCQLLEYLLLIEPTKALLPTPLSACGAPCIDNE